MISNLGIFSEVCVCHVVYYISLDNLTFPFRKASFGVRMLQRMSLFPSPLRVILLAACALPT